MNLAILGKKKRKHKIFVITAISLTEGVQQGMLFTITQTWRHVYVCNETYFCL